ncbi:MAG: helix-turn-helix transcriptional regulator [Clostridia bacterium]|nr:helix-turn-helix transcriptional regulator [Clostridia bacterium]
MKIGNRIKELRTRRGLTQEALALAFGVTPQTVSKWECEINFPDVSLLPELSVFFGVSIDSLFSLTRADKLERIDNRISEAGLLDDDEVAQIEDILKESSSDPESKADGLTLLAKLYNHQADACLKIAFDYAEEAVEASDGSSEALKQYARASSSAKFGVKDDSHRKLISYLKDYLSRNPDSADACAMLIDNLVADARIKEASLWTEHLLKIDNTYRALVYRYNDFALNGDEASALAAIALLEETYGDSPDALMSIADIRMKRAEYDKVIVCCLKASDLYPSPKQTGPLLVAAHVSELLDRTQDAVSYYRDALKILKEDWGIVSGERVDDIRKEIKKLSTND